jgi:hypothetical protein
MGNQTAQACQLALPRAADRRQRRPRLRHLRIRAYVRKVLAGSSSATSSTVRTPRSRSSYKKPYARKAHGGVVMKARLETPLEMVQPQLLLELG